MREEFYIRGMQEIHARCQRLEERMQGIYKVLEEIIGKELLRGQALHKVLMDKALFTDAELKMALEKLVEESKVELNKLKEEAATAKAKAIELLIPQGANLTPPSETVPTPEAVNQEVPSAEPPATNNQ